MSHGWIETGERIARDMRRVQWELGAWWASRPPSMNACHQGASLVGFSHHHLTKMARVYEAYAHEDFIPEISFSHHESAATLPPTTRTELLKRAATEHLTLDEFRGLVRAAKEKNQ